MFSVLLSLSLSLEWANCHAKGPIATLLHNLRLVKQENNKKKTLGFTLNPWIPYPLMQLFKDRAHIGVI
jgi:hypothetical protein